MSVGTVRRGYKGAIASRTSVRYMVGLINLWYPGVTYVASLPSEPPRQRRNMYGEAKILTAGDSYSPWKLLGEGD